MSEALTAVRRQAEQEASREAARAEREAARRVERRAHARREAEVRIKRTFGFPADIIITDERSGYNGTGGSMRFVDEWHFTFTADGHSFQGRIVLAASRPDSEPYWAEMAVSYVRWHNIDALQMQAILEGGYQLNLRERLTALFR